MPTTIKLMPAIFRAAVMFARLAYMDAFRDEFAGVATDVAEVVKIAEMTV